MRIPRSKSAWLALLVCTLTAVLCLTAQAGIRGPGKYCGVVIFDRWGTCFLLSGHFITYISESAKEELRPYLGTAIQIDASEVLQPRNPGDALIKKFQIIGPAANPRDLVLQVKDAFGPDHRPTFELRVGNQGSEIVRISSANFGPTLIGVNRETALSPSDGASQAWITRQDLVDRSTNGDTFGGSTDVSSFKVDPKTPLPLQLQIAPGQSVDFRIALKVPPGQYQFMVGYGGGVHETKSLASNAVSFDLDTHGFATLAPR